MDVCPSFFKPFFFAKCKVKTTVRERAFFIGRMLAFGDLEAKCPRLPLKKSTNNGTSGRDGWTFQGYIKLRGANAQGTACMSFQNGKPLGSLFHHVLLGPVGRQRLPEIEISCRIPRKYIVSSGWI